jgi:flagellar biosynthesis/type III secretory pathway protein FliH
MNWQRIKQSNYVDSTIKEFKDKSEFEIEEYLFKLCESVDVIGYEEGYAEGEDRGREISDSRLEDQIHELECEIDDLKLENYDLEKRLKELE